MLQAAAWLARLALRISHAMSAGTSLAPDKKQKARLRGLLVLTWRRRSLPDGCFIERHNKSYLIVFNRQLIIYCVIKRHGIS